MKATPDSVMALIARIEQYGVRKFSQGVNEAAKDRECAAQDKAAANGYLADITAEVERLAAQSAPLAQQAAREYPPLPRELLPGESTGEIWRTFFVWANDYATGTCAKAGKSAETANGILADTLRAYVDADRAAAQVEQYMPSGEWLAEAIDLVAHIGPMTDRLRAHLSKRVTAPQLKHAGWFQELPSGMSYRLWEQGGHEAQPGDVELFEVVIPADGEVRPTQAQGQDAAPAEQVQEFWLWQNFVDGRPEYWAFDNPYPIKLTDGDPQTLGEPCGYAIFKPSRNGRPDVPRAQVIAAIKRAKE